MFLRACLRNFLNRIVNMKKMTLSLGGLVVAGSLMLMTAQGAIAGEGCGSCAGAKAPAVSTTQPTTKPCKDAGAYTCPMHADVAADKAGKCSKCGMALEKKAAEKGA